MKYAVDYAPAAIKSLRKMDASIARMIVGWVRKNLVGCTDPRVHGKALAANHAGQWRYRVGDYRLIAEIHDATVTILVLNIGHRREIYES